MENFIVGLCMGGLIACILYWERRANKRWADTFDVRLPEYQRKYFNEDQHRNGS
jgi:hypothetical protein